MRYASLEPSDDVLNVHVLYRQDEHGVLVVRARYANLVCPGKQCGKIDEYAALGRGVDRVLVPEARHDYARTLDDFIAVSRRFREWLANHRVAGIEFLPLGSGGWSVAWPQVVAHVNTSRCGMRFRGRPCSVCGRYRQTSFAPVIASLLVPADPPPIFTADVRPETRRWRMGMLYGSEEVVALMRRDGLTGIDWPTVERTLAEVGRDG